MNNENENKYVSKDIFDSELQSLKQRMTDTRDDLNRNLQFHGHLISVIAMLFAGVQIGIALFLYILTR